MIKSSEQKAFSRVSHIRWFLLASTRRTEPIFEQTRNNALCVATAPDGKTLAVGTRTGDVHLWSISARPQPPLLKHFCRLLINSQAGLKRNAIVHLPLSQYLITYLLYRDI
jgi:hypothetical protein